MSLTIQIHSFSYKKGGIPVDETDNGGGFVFDCRGILNPGRIDEYKQQTGADGPVQEYLVTRTQMNEYLDLVKKLVSISVDNYLQRDFENLKIAFGCTGGQHRSVYCAIKLAEYLREKYPQVSVNVHHDEQPHLNLK